MSEQNHRGKYDHVKCPVCAYPWLEHPTRTLCNRHRPTGITPPWVGEALARHELAATASHLPASIDDAEVARLELAGGVPTREWPEITGFTIPPGEFLAAVMARANGKDGGSHA